MEQDEKRKKKRNVAQKCCEKHSYSAHAQVMAIHSQSLCQVWPVLLLILALTKKNFQAITAHAKLL